MDAAPLATGGAAVAWLAAAATAWLLFRWVLNRWRFRRIPGPFAPPLVGNIPGLSRRGFPAYLDDCRSRYGRLFKIYLGSRMMIIVSEPDLARRVQYKLLNHAAAIGVQLSADRSADPASSKGLLVARDDQWRALRAAWLPAFSSASLEGYASLMDGCALRLRDRLLAVAGKGRTVDVWREVGKMTLSVVGTCAYGVDFRTMDGPHADTGDDEAHRLITASQRFFESGLLSGTAWGRLLLLFPDAKAAVQWLAARLPDQPLLDLTEARATIFAVPARGGAPSKDSGRGVPGISPGSFLGLLLDGDRAARHFDDSTVVAQGAGFILAGYETTANTLAFTIWCISAHPRAQERVLAEVDAFGRGREVTYADVQGGAFTYLAAALKESMRLFPAASMTNREVTKEDGFDLAPGIHVPKGALLYTAMYLYHRDPEIWPRALDFLPERHLPEGGSALGPSNGNALTPFGGGARLCVGYKFAQLEAVITLVRLYQRLTFELQPGMVPLPLKQNLTLSPRDGVVVRPIARV